MFQASESVVFWLAVFTQVIGAASIVAARLSESSERPASAQIFFLVCLLAVGGVTAFAFNHGSGTWLFNAATLAVMSIGATLDLRNVSAASAF